MKPFANEPLTDFSKASTKKAFRAALEKIAEQVDKTYPLVIGGEPVESGRTFTSVNPAQPTQVLGTFAKAGRKEAKLAVEAAAKAFPSWGRLPARTRARYLFEAAAKMRARKHEFSAAMVLEGGKSWVEADGDTAEAIDFLDFYAREAIRLAGNRECTQIPEEIAELFYIPLGVGAIIPPWNFPNAILIGMTAAAVVAGNTVVLKPASDTPLVGQMVFDLFDQLGLPPGVINFLPGPGAAAGDALVTHPQVRFISFTGSKDVGLGIVEKAGQRIEGQRWIKRVMAEMGGKDTMIIADDADLDKAAAAVAASAFGYQGQKCSACSRCIVMSEVYEPFVERLLAKTQALVVGDPSHPKTYMGPMINKRALRKVMDYIRIGNKEGTLLTGGKPIEMEGGGYFVEPTIFADIAPGSPLDQDEIFGPLLTLLRADSYDEALALANATVYGLTGAVWTQDRMRMEKARQEFFVGNLYFNRKSTGALVDVHPFGGFDLSGTNTKAGGRDYLLMLMQAKSVSEKID